MKIENPSGHTGSPSSLLQVPWPPHTPLPLSGQSIADLLERGWLRFLALQSATCLFPLMVYFDFNSTRQQVFVFCPGLSSHENLYCTQIGGILLRIDHPMFLVPAGILHVYKQVKSSTDSLAKWIQWVWGLRRLRGRKGPGFPLRLASSLGKVFTVAKGVPSS